MRSRLAALALATAVVLAAGFGISQSADAQTDRFQQREERLQQMVDEGRISQERADEIRARLAERAERHEERRAARADLLSDIATTLGTNADGLKADLRAGASLADLAAAAGVDVDVIIDQIEDHQSARIEAAVADGSIDQATADERLGTLRERITARVNGERPERADRPHHMRGPRGFGRSGN